MIIKINIYNEKIEMIEIELVKGRNDKEKHLFQILNAVDS